MAEQEEPVHRRVALKLIKPGMDTKSVIARFEAERQALALMDHPNIAHVFDAGATESGRPYFVMELVEGTKITDFCDQYSLGTSARLELFVQVCDAVQHAHQKGIIHRDLKPSNILVTTTPDGKPVPKVIDFGIAKATTGQQLTDKTIFTAFEMLIGTPAYMSPEQAVVSNVEVDTRTDIYSLGVLLYELLTGTTPFDARELFKAGLDEVRRTIRDEEPVRPSTRLSTMKVENLTEISRRRHAAPPTLIREVRGDLDWIVMQALEKDRARRYKTANGLALDVQRYLAVEPISARPPSKIYKLQKTMKRNKLLFAGVSVIALLIVTSLIVVSASLAKERRSRREAEAAKAKAEAASLKSQQVTKFLEDMLSGVGPSAALGQDTKMLRGILDRTAERIGQEMTNQPAVEAELRSLIGTLYFEIGNYTAAEKMQRTALAINRELFGSESKEAAASLNDLGLVFWKQGNLTEAESAHRQALEIRQRLFGKEHPSAAASLNDLATVYRHQRKLLHADEMIREALRIRRKSFGNEHLEIADSLHNLSIVLADEGKGAESEATARELVAMRRRLLGNEDPLVAAALNDLAHSLGFTGKLEESESVQREALAMQRKLLGDDHPNVSISLSALAERMRQRGKVAEALALSGAVLAIQREQLGENSPDFIHSLSSLGVTLEAQGKLPEGEAAHREALALWRKRAGNESPQALSALGDVNRLLVSQRKFADAERLLDETLTPAVIKQSGSAKLLLLRAELRARRNQWPQAATDAALAMDLQPSRDSSFPILAALLVKTHNRPEYEKLSRRLLTTHANTSNFYLADNVAKACLFLPASRADLEIIANLADTTVTHGIGNKGAMPYFQVCKALSEYRQGHYAEAVEWAQKPLKVPGVAAHGHAYGVLALAYWGLEKKEEARAMLAKGNQLAPRIMPTGIAGEPGSGWLAWLYARIQLDEATALIQPGLATDNNSNKP